jgi:hypothetical protein
MVAGPWTYVADPDHPGRVVAIAPEALHHRLAVVSGENADNYSQGIPLPAGKYEIDFPTVSCPPKPAGKRPAKPYPIDRVPALGIQAAVNGLTVSRFAFSLPAPCYYESFREYESKIDQHPETLSQGTKYTTWMILHYSVPSVGLATLAGRPDSGFFVYNVSVQFGSNTGGPAKAISLVMAAPDPDNDTTCDVVSSESFLLSLKLFGIKNLAVQFPETSDGVQTSLYSCQKGLTLAAIFESISQVRINLRSPTRAEIDKARQNLQGLNTVVKELWADKVPENVQTDLQETSSLLEHMTTDTAIHGIGLQQVLDVTEHEAMKKSFFKPGAGDCRSAQLNINGAVR